jgi:UDP-2,4-diacetamido-2,4,6-trideoxy-beta-L-altropyranose hydrolase
MKEKIGIRVDASNIIGAGHVYRCLIIADELKKRKIEPIFICQKFKFSLINFIKSKKFKVVTINHQFNLKEKKRLKNHFLIWSKRMQINDYNYTIKASKNFGLKKIIVDHYGLGVFWQKKITQLHKLIVIDDLFNRHNYCNLYINYNKRHDKNSKSFTLRKNCKLLLGLKYLIVNKIYNVSRKNIEKISSEKIFLYMGFADKKNFTKKLLGLLTHKRFNKYKIYVFSIKKNLIKKYQNYDNIYFISKAKKNLRKLYLDSKIIFSSAGLSMYEQILCRSNSIFFPQNSFQENICNYLKKEKYIKYVKYLNKVNIRKLEEYIGNNRTYERRFLQCENTNKKVAKIIIAA